MNTRARFPSVLALVACAALWGCFDDAKPEPCLGTILPDRTPERVSIEQGVWGNVWFWEGDFMPICPSGEVRPVGRELRIHVLTNLDDVERASGAYFFTFFRRVDTELVARVWSDAEGFFQAGLGPGRYSVFVVEDSLLYANGGDGQGNIMPFEVRPGEVTEGRIDITYLASS